MSSKYRWMIQWAFLCIFQGIEAQTTQQGCSQEINLCVTPMIPYERQFQGYLPYFNDSDTWTEACRVVGEVDACVQASFPFCTASEKIIWTTVVEGYDHICQGDLATSEYLRYRGCFGMDAAFTTQDSCNKTYTNDYTDTYKLYAARTISSDQYAERICRAFIDLFDCVKEGILNLCGEPASRWIYDHFEIVFSKFLGQIRCEIPSYDPVPAGASECQLFSILACYQPVSDLDFELATIPLLNQTTLLDFCQAHTKVKICIKSLGNCDGLKPVYEGINKARDFLCYDIEGYQRHLPCLESEALKLTTREGRCKAVVEEEFREHEEALQAQPDRDIDTFHRETCRTVEDYMRCLLTPVYQTCGCKTTDWLGVYTLLQESENLGAINCKIDLETMIPGCPRPTLPVFPLPDRTTTSSTDTSDASTIQQSLLKIVIVFVISSLASPFH